MFRSNSCLACTYLIEFVAGIVTGYTFIYFDDVVVIRFVLLILYIPAILVLVDAKSKILRFLVYFMLTAVCFWGILYAIYFRIPFGFSLIFCVFVGFVYYIVFTDKSTKDKMSAIIIVNRYFFTLVFLIALSCNLMFNPIQAPLLNSGAIIVGLSMMCYKNQKILPLDKSKFRAVVALNALYLKRKFFYEVFKKNCRGICTVFLKGFQVPKS